jgi:serine/threonine-protein kinase HipA
MTARRSKPVWIWLPDSSEPALAGSFSWEPGLGRFFYDGEYRDRDGWLPLDPLRLPVTRARRGSTETANNGVFGVFRDASPEGFGLALLERKTGRPLDELDRLEQAPGDSVGAIEIGDDISHKLEWHPPPMQRLIDALENLPQTRGDGAAAREASGLPGTSMGGERPKLTVMHDDQWWLAKLQDRGDLPHYPAREYVGMRLATRCGIEAAQVEFHRAGERELIAVKRFDRSRSEAGMVRHAFASAHTVLHLGRGEVRGDRARSYPGFAHELRRWCGAAGVDIVAMQRELWRRMTFNALIGNGDDHPRNHAVLHRNGNWGLSPAYDVVPHPQHGGTLSMAMTRDGDAIVNVENVLRACENFGYELEEGRNDLLVMAERVMGGWESVLRETGFEPGDIPDLAASFTLAREVADTLSERSRPSWETADGGYSGPT